MTSNFDIGRRLDKLADKLAKIDQGKIGKLVTETTLEAHEAIVDKITNDIRPHSGLSRTPPVATVTDLVDTGFYRQSWQTSFPSSMKGKVSTNADYALALEFGEAGRKGFFPARDTAKKMEDVFLKKGVKLIKDALR